MTLQTVIRTEASVQVDKSCQAVSRFVADEFFDNYPRWSPEVTLLEKITPGPLRVGTSGRQVRNDAGHVTASTFRVTAYHPLREIAFASTDSPGYQVRYTFREEGNTTRVTFSFELRMTWMLKPFEPLITSMIHDQSRRMMSNLGTLLEG